MRARNAGLILGRGLAISRGVGRGVEHGSPRAGNWNHKIVLFVALNRLIGITIVTQCYKRPGYIGQTAIEKEIDAGIPRDASPGCCNAAGGYRCRRNGVSRLHRRRLLPDTSCFPLAVVETARATGCYFGSAGFGHAPAAATMPAPNNGDTPRRSAVFSPASFDSQEPAGFRDDAFMVSSSDSEPSQAGNRERSLLAMAASASGPAMVSGDSESVSERKGMGPSSDQAGPTAERRREGAFLHLSLRGQASEPPRQEASLASVLQRVSS